MRLGLDFFCSDFSAANLTKSATIYLHTCTFGVKMKDSHNLYFNQIPPFKTITHYRAELLRLVVPGSYIDFAVIMDYTIWWDNVF